MWCSAEPWKRQATLANRWQERIPFCPNLPNQNQSSKFLVNQFQFLFVFFNYSNSNSLDCYIFAVFQNACKTQNTSVKTDPAQSGNRLSDLHNGTSYAAVTRLDLLEDDSAGAGSRADSWGDCSFHGADHLHRLLLVVCAAHLSGVGGGPCRAIRSPECPLRTSPVRWHKPFRYLNGTITAQCINTLLQ